ncbi:hypothetical protein CSKR_108102 [Clonorchis sinensis]|uniref:Uncharacterized protein n=1 Tax=Clonorchis sinensis TaxID=79923 RepID=A0A419PRP9_CLOSI|nr:hypothetical protein CSKR_108102 [Clonorchis sinensis]
MFPTQISQNSRQSNDTKVSDEAFNKAPLICVARKRNPSHSQFNSGNSPSVRSHLIRNDCDGVQPHKQAFNTTTNKELNPTKDTGDALVYQKKCQNTKSKSVTRVNVEAAPKCVLQLQRSDHPSIVTKSEMDHFVPAASEVSQHTSVTRDVPASNLHLPLQREQRQDFSNAHKRSSLRYIDASLTGGPIKIKNVQFEPHRNEDFSSSWPRQQISDVKELYGKLAQKDEEIRQRDIRIHELQEIILEHNQLLSRLTGVRWNEERPFLRNAGINLEQHLRTSLAGLVTPDTNSSGYGKGIFVEKNSVVPQLPVRHNFLEELSMTAWPVQRGITASAMQNYIAAEKRIDSSRNTKPLHPFKLPKRRKRYAISGESSQYLLTPSSQLAQLPKFTKSDSPMLTARLLVLTWHFFEGRSLESRHRSNSCPFWTSTPPGHFHTPGKLYPTPSSDSPSDVGQRKADPPSELRRHPDPIPLKTKICSVCLLDRSWRDLYKGKFGLPLDAEKYWKQVLSAPKHVDSRPSRVVVPSDWSLIEPITGEEVGRRFV